MKMGSFERCVAFTGDNCNTNFGGVYCIRKEIAYFQN